MKSNFKIYGGMHLKDNIKRIHNYLQKLSILRFIILMVLLTYVLIIPFIPVFYFYEKYIGSMGGADNLKEMSIVLKIVIASIVGPLIETTIFQYGVIEKLSSTKRFKHKKITISIVSALLFGISHSYSCLYVFYAFLIGLLLAYSYLIYRDKDISAFWVVFSIHCIRNTIYTLLNM